MRRRTLALPALSAIALAWACLGGAVAEDGPQNEQDIVVANVGGHTIYLSEVVSEIVSLPAQQQRGAGFDELYKKILGRMVDEALVLEAAVDSGLKESEQHIERMQEIEEQLLRDQYLTGRLQAKLTDAALRARYEERKAAAEPQQEVRARHILVRTEEEAAAIREEIAAGGDFLALAKEHSVAPGAAEGGGDLGYFAREAMVEPIADAAFALEPGSVSEPIQTQFGWHLVKVEDRRDAAFPPFEEMQDQIAREMAQEVVAEIVADLRSEADVELFMRDGTPLELSETP